MRRIIADHTNPPLFYLLLKGWVAIGGDAEAWLRLLPCLFAILLGAAMAWLVEEAALGALPGMLAIALAAASPLSVDLANEVRAYSLLALLACLSLAAALRVRRDPSRAAWALLAFLNVMLVHTHYFGWLTIGAEVIAATAWWSRDAARRVLRAAMVALLAFVPWAAVVLAHALRTPAPLSNVSWISAPTLDAPIVLVRDFTGRWSADTANLAWLALLGAAGIALAVAMRRRRAVLPGDRPVDVGAIALFATAALAMPLLIWGASLAAGQPFWVQRYLSGAAAPLAALAAVALCALPPRRWPVAATIGLIWAAGSFAALPTRAPTKFDWRRFSRRLDAAPGSPRTLYTLEAFTGAPLLHYAGVGMQVSVVRSLDEIPAGEAWLVVRRDTFGDRSPSTVATEHGLRVRAAVSAEQGGQAMVALRVDR